MANEHQIFHGLVHTKILLEPLGFIYTKRRRKVNFFFDLCRPQDQTAPREQTPLPEQRRLLLRTLRILLECILVSLIFAAAKYDHHIGCSFGPSESDVAFAFHSIQTKFGTHRSEQALRIGA